MSVAPTAQLADLSLPTTPATTREPKYGDPDCEQLFFSRLAATGYRPGVVLDIGGSTGCWSAAINPIFPEARYEIFEPLAGRTGDYDEKLRANLDTHSNFRLHAVALSERPGIADFWLQPSGLGSSLLFESMPYGSKIQVPCETLDAYIEQHQIPQPQIIKADVQAGELKVIRGGAKAFANADVVLLETWFRRYYGPENPLLPELMEVLGQMGFYMVQLGDYWRDETHEIGSVDAFWMHKRLIKSLKRQNAAFPWPVCWASEHRVPPL